LDRELQQYYDNRFTLCSSIGWEQLLEDLLQSRNELAKIENISSQEELWKNKGKVEVLDYILNLKEISEKVYQEILDDKKNI
jgi:hypothetical protein